MDDEPRSPSAPPPYDYSRNTAAQNPYNYGRNPFDSHDPDSDPEEEDIENHISHGPGGFFAHRTVYRSPEGDNPGNEGRARPEDGEDVVRRFQQLLGDISGPGMPGGPRPGLFFDEPGSRAQVRVTRFTSRPFPGGVSSFSITTGGTRPLRTGGSPNPEDDPFQSYASTPHNHPGPSRITWVSSLSAHANTNSRVFGSIFGQVGGPPPVHRDGPDTPGAHGGPAGAAGPTADFSAALHQLFAQFLNPHAVHGDVVYSQEGLDRIITNLMEAHPQSNASPPATEETIAKLPRKKLDQEMLGSDPKAECTICIDDLSLGDEVLVLPCKHWFHGECVVLWLKEHNTCPICRSPVENNARSESANTAGATAPESSASTSAPASASASVFASTSAASRPAGGAAERRRSNLRQHAEQRMDAIRAMSNDSRGGAPRRNSNSPPMNPPSTQRSRVRSPSPLERRRSDQSDQGNGGNGGSGPLNWLRGTFNRDRNR